MRRLHLVLPLRACRCLKTFSPPDSPSFLPVGSAPGVEGRLVRGAAALPPVCADLSPKNLFASLRRPLRAGVFAFASLILLVVLPRSSPICCPRRRAGTPALLCALFVAISLLLSSFEIVCSVCVVRLVQTHGSSLSSARLTHAPVRARGA